MNTSPPDFRLLQCFEALMAERSVSRAAARLRLSQPAMSHALARLRALFGDPLLLKGHGHMTPTGRAVDLVPQVRELLARAERLTSRPEMFDPARTRTGFVVMAAEYVEYLLAPRLVERLQREAPGVDVEFRVADRDRALSWFERGEIDFRLGWWPKPAQALRYKLLFRDRLVCLARKGHPRVRGAITVEQFLAAPHARVVTPRPGISMLAIDEAVSALHRRLRVAAAVQNAFALAHVVSQTGLLACVTERLARRLAEKYPLQVLPLPIGVPDVRMALYWHERTHKQPAHRWFRQLLAETAAAL